MSAKTVYQAESPRFGAMGSLGNASYMLIRQHQFPHKYDDDLDQLLGCDHDRIVSNKFEHAQRCFKHHTGTGDLGLEYWARQAHPSKILKFVKDILEADPKVKWTGFRITGTVNRGNGFPVWRLELFSKSPLSDTQVFKTENVPHLIQGSRHTHH